MSKSNGAEFLAGLLAGAFFGGAAALLMAPKSGPQIRESFLREAWRVLLKATDGQAIEEWANNEERKTVEENLESLRSAGM